MHPFGSNTKLKINPKTTQNACQELLTPKQQKHKFVEDQIVVGCSAYGERHSQQEPCCKSIKNHTE